MQEEMSNNLIGNQIASFVQSHLEKNEEKWSLCEIVRQEAGKDKPDTTKNKFLENIGERTDEHALAIKRRLLSCSDFPTVEGRYHMQRHIKYEISIRVPTIRETW